MWRNLIRAIVPRVFLPSWILENHLKSLTEGGTMVVQGPFKGIRLRSESYFSPIYNKLLGSYERELHKAIEEVIAMDLELVIDIGAAEGYYVCGLAKKCGQRTRHVAFESDYRSRFVLRRNLEANDLSERVTIGEHCSISKLQRVLESTSGGVFILCDVEGMEAELLDPKLVPGVINATILVELHEFAIRGVADYLKGQFGPTHIIEEIHSQPRNREDLIEDKSLPWARWLPRSTVARFADERPIKQSWLFLKRKAERFS